MISKPDKDWKCPCNNPLEQDSFDEYQDVADEAQYFSPDEFQQWSQTQTRTFFCCNRCGTIIDRDSLVVLGKVLGADAHTVIDQIMQEQLKGGL